MNDETISFADFTADHLDGALALSAAAGWPHRRDDWALVFGLGRGFVALADGRVVGTMLATPQGDVAMLNMLIVEAGLRGRGIGRALMERALASTADRERRLVATAEGAPLYRRLGFVETGAIVQHGGACPVLAAPAGIEPARPDDHAAIVGLDRAATGADRTAMWAAFAGVAERTVLRRDGGVRGFAASRRFGRGEVIGPVIAETLDDAERLVVEALSRRAGGYVRIDTTGSCGLSARLAALGLPIVGGGIAMRSQARDRPPAGVGVFGLAAQALG
jgi:GNAT superfamily N-acetyltransferase